MSHSVTITRTTTTASTSYIVLNTGYMKTVPGLLKFFQLILGIVCVGIITYYFAPGSYYRFRDSEILFFLMSVTFMVGTFCLLLSCLCSLSTGGLISKTIYELIYHSIAFILILVASILLLADTLNNKTYYSKSSKGYDSYLAASIIGIVNAILYAVSAFYAHRSYRGI